jgi:hypothetical protein
VLRACRKLLKPGGRLACATIYIDPSASDRDYRRAARVRGPGSATRRAMTELLEGAGFVGVRERDVTTAFLRTARAYVDTSAQFRDELLAAWGDELFADRLRDRTATLELIETGVLRRGIFAARRP